MATVAVPTVDLSAPDAEAAAAVEAACAAHGFLFLRGHGVGPEVSARACAAYRELFARGDEEKRALMAGPGRAPLGYTPRGVLRLDPQGQSEPDTRQQYKAGPPHYDADYAAGRDAPAEPVAAFAPPPDAPYWPHGLPGFKEAVAEYFEAVRVAGDRLMRLVALSLGAEEGALGAPLFDRAMHLLNANLYDAEPSREEAGVFGCGAHTDYGSITLLCVEGGAPGLELCENPEAPRAERRWAPVVPPDGVLVVNVGEMLERWSNGRYKAALHRVVSPAGTTKERLSIAFFYEPNLCASVAPLPEACGGGAPAFPSISFAEFLHQKFADTGEHKDKDGAAAQ